MNKIVKILLPVLVLVISVIVVRGLVAAKPPPEKKEQTQRLLSLYVDLVSSEDVTVGVSSQGEVTPKVEIDLIPQVSGRILAVADTFAEGAEFNPGTVLIKIDDTDYKLSVVRAEARVAEAQVSVARELANAKIKKDEWDRKRNAGTPTDFALNKPQVLSALAQLRAAEADLHEARLNVQRTSIKVPFKGRVRSKVIGVGQYVSAGTPLGRVFSTDTVEVKLPLTDSQLAELNLPMGFMVGKENAPVVNFSARIGKHEYNWQGHIVRVNAAVDQQTRLIYATAEVQDPYGLGVDGEAPMAVGMFVRARIEGVNSQTALVIPRMGLRKSDKVYVINDDSRLEIRTVDVISTSDSIVYLASGVEAGEQVVTSTIPAAVAGMAVIALSREMDTESEESGYQPEDLFSLEDEPENNFSYSDDSEQEAQSDTTSADAEAGSL